MIYQRQPKISAQKVSSVSSEGETSENKEVDMQTVIPKMSKRRLLGTILEWMETRKWRVF